MSERITLKSLSARQDSIEAKLDRLIAALEPKAPAKTVTKAEPKAPRKAKTQPKAAYVAMATSHTFLGERVGTGSRKLTKENRKAFIAAHAWAKPGMSTSTLRSEVAMGRKVNKGWNVAV
jgi:hypothetical protein